MMKRPILFILVVLALAAPTAFAGSEDPIMQRGFSPETLYQFDSLDNVNLFNGNLIVTLPIGQSYPVASGFTYQLRLSYNSKVWDLSARAYGDPGFCTSPNGYFYIPNRKSNAGMGWSLGYGRMFPACHPANEGLDDVYLTFESPDGGSHAFTVSTEGGDTLYTSDNSHLRVRNYLSSVIELDFPDGTRYYYEKNGCNELKLSSMVDASGNTVNVTYDAGNYTQTMTDPYGRKTVIRYVNATPNDAYDRVISSIDVPVFATGTTLPDNAKATYYFGYTYPRLDIPMASAECAQYTFETPMLSTITRPDGSSFTFEYGYYGVNAQHKGSLLVLMTLPTKGKFEWEYDGWELPGPTCEAVTPWAMGVVKRKFQDPVKGTLDTWTYDSILDAGPMDSDPYYCPPLTVFPVYEVGQWPKEQSRTIVTDPRGDKTVHFFSVWQGRKLWDETNDGNSDAGYEYRDYGLSMTRLEPTSDNTFLSTRRYDCGGTGTCAADNNPDRSTYVLYEHHYPGSGYYGRGPFDVMPRRTRTVFDKDVRPTGKAYIDVTSTDYDGYGHYRTVTTSGNFGPGGAVQSRTVTTNYNGADPEVGDPSVHYSIRPSGGSWTLGFVPYPSWETWILNTYTSITTEEAGRTSKQLFLFNRWNGFLERTRLRRGALSGGRYTDLGNTRNDLVTVFERTSLISGLQAVGEVAAEAHYGGDIDLLPDTTTPLIELNLGAAPAGGRVAYTYKYGAAATSLIDGAPYATLNADIDRNTGYAKSSTDPAGHQTKFEFDTMARISKQTLPSGTITDYTYPITTRATATSTTHPANSTTNILQKSTYLFDGFGRVSVVKDMMADGTDNERTMTWNALGQKTAETAAAVAGSTGAQTTYTYDAFGRQVTMIPPDGEKHTVKTDYTGVRVQTTTSGKTTAGGTGGIGMYLDFYGDVVEEPAVVSMEEYDAFSRLAKITEYGHGTNAPVTTGTYTYDVGGRLATATVAAAEGTQPARSFVYDNRGYLMSQTLPETGTTEFQNYNSLGQASRRLQGSAGGPFDLTFVYDIYQHLTEIRQGSTVLKKFFFDSLPPGDPQGSYTELGQIVKTYRRNFHTELGGDVPVNTYLRYDAAGRLNEKKTVVGSGPAFTQKYTYNDLDDIATLEYPSCAGCSPLATGGSIPSRTLSFRYSRGYLTGIDEGSNRFTSATPGKEMSYWPNGMLKSVTHVARNNTSEVVDTQTLDAGMNRPGSITFSGASTCTPPSATISGPSSIPAGTSGTASVTVTSGASYAWSIQNGAILSGQNTSTITFTAFCGGAGNVVLTATVTSSSGCSASPTKTITVTGGSGATATVYGSHTITSGGGAQIEAYFTGTAPFTIVWSDGFVQSNLTYTSISRHVTPTTSTVYTVTSISDAYGCGTASGQVFITVSGYCTPSDSTITAPSTLAAGQTFTFYFAASPPGSGAGFAVDNADFVTATNTSATFTVDCSGLPVRIERSIGTSPNYCGSQATKTINVTKPTATVSGSQTISPPNGATIIASLTGTAPWTVYWSDGFTQTNVYSSMATRNVYPTVDTTYTVTAVVDAYGCPGTSTGFAAITTCTPPSATITAPSSVAAGATFTATCNRPSGGSCSWSAQNATFLSSTASSVTYRAACSGTVTVNLTVYSGSCSASSSKAISIVRSTAAVSGSQTIVQGGSTPISANLTGTGPWTVTWSDGVTQTNVTSSPAQRSVSPGVTTTYTVIALTDGNNCGGTTSGAAVVTVLPPAPTGLVATAVSTTQINVSWAFSGSMDRFDLYRNGVVVYSGSAASYNDTGVQAGNAYWYMAVAVKGSAASAESSRDVATTIFFANDPLIAGVAQVSALHFTQVRAAINAVRVTSGLTPYSFPSNIASGMAVYAAQVTEMRTVLNEARARLVLPAVVYERPTLTPGMPIKVRDITDLRDGVK